MPQINLGNLLILGDSYSTFLGYIPEGFCSYYGWENGPDTDVRRVEDIWWHRLITQTQCNLVLNSSWSGSTICNTGYDGADVSDSSFISRFDKLVKEGFFEKQPIDTMLVLGGTNDSWAGSPVGEPKWENWGKEDLYQVAPAVCYLVYRIRQTLPGVKVCFLLNSGLSREVTGSIKLACNRYDANTVELPDMDKAEGHPTVKGMGQITQKIISYFEAKQ